MLASTGYAINNDKVMRLKISRHVYEAMIDARILRASEKQARDPTLVGPAVFRHRILSA